MASFDQNTKSDGLIEKLVNVNRNSKTVKGGRTFSFGALVVHSLVTVPRDAKDDNIRVSKDGHLISIDNDKALNEMISEKECNCGMYQVLNGKCIIGECVTIVHSNLKEYKNGRKPKTA